MKLRSIFVPIVLLAAVAASAQTPRAIPDSLKYALPEFAAGRVVFDDGHAATGVFNFSYLDQTIRFKDGDKVMALADNAFVKSLSAGGRIFTRDRDHFIETIDYVGAISLCIFKDVHIQREANAGAYGFTDQASNVRTQNMRDVDARYQDLTQTYDLEQELVLPYNYREAFFLMDGKNIYKAGKQSFRKCFSSEKAKVDEYLSTHEVDYNSREDVTAFFKAMKGM
ncbi:MAG: hypothetical protein IKZ72_04510 [Bacteroidales bacterium]|nr:hypothetical protein [Bacteroidales bacterium]